ncbi:MAG: hypothetical protein DCF21_21935 [Leptolyngbya sp.]|jgi:hypothetical protein|nr:MAG: hypothetical protein DCF21_21935 [Leptolyngbya sp.]
MSQQHLLNSAVFDRSGYLIGNVVSIQSTTVEDFALIVQLLEHDGGDNQVTIYNTSIKDIDSENNIIHVYLDRQQVAPHADQRIQLVEERLVVNRKRVKVGEVSVRRVVETEMVEVPIRREKLVVEKIGDRASSVEIQLGETLLQGDEIAAQSTGDRNQDITASGSFKTIKDAITFLEAAAQRPDQPCEKVKVAILLDGNSELKETIYEFDSPQTAIQKILQLDRVLLNQCSQVRLDLFLKDPAMVQTYQDWIAQYISS